jgi:benzoyl-CoA reductase/2-hydroxyglutaryl-CoA dehydratase subunit BcrC/BadD/HgdB
MDEFRRSGGLVLGYLCQGFPASVAAGLGMWPVRVLQGATTGMEDRGGALVRPDVCPLVRSFAGCVSAGSGIHGLVDVWAGLSTCDQTRRCFSELPCLTGAEVVQLHLPATRSVAGEDYFAASVEGFCLESAARFGCGYEPDRALDHASERHRAGMFLESLTLEGSVDPLDLHWMYHLYHMARAPGLHGLLEGMLTPADPSRRRPVSVGLAGSPLPLEDTTVLEVLSGAGAGVVPLHCAALQSTGTAGDRSAPADGSPGGLARAAFRSVRCARSRPNDGVFEWISGMMERTGCRGLVVKTMRFCDLWFTERVRFRERMDVPVLVMDTAFSQGERERQTARLEAFLEMVLP